MKKELSLLLTLIFIVICFIGCNTTDEPTNTDDTDHSSEEITSTTATEATSLTETSSTAWTRDESKHASYLSELGVATQTVHYNTDETTSVSSPSNIQSRTWEPFKMMGSPLLECHRNFLLSDRGGWTRAPYYDHEANERDVTVYENGEGIYVFDLENCQPYEDVVYKYYDGGRYRVIFYLNDGPHYVTFIADGPPER